MPTLLELPSELLELNVCQYLDVSSLTQLTLVNRHLEREITHCSELWALLVARYFGYVDKSQPAGRLPGNETETKTTSINWKAVFAGAWQDTLMLSATTLQESDVVQIYHRQNDCPKLLRPREIQIRRELMLIQGLRRFPTSIDIIHLYAEVIRQAHLVPRVNAANTASALRRLTL